MKPRLLLCTLAIVAALAGVLAEAGSVRQARAANDCGAHSLPGQLQSAAFVKKLDQAWGRAWHSGDVNFLDCLYDPNWRYLTPKGITNKSQDLADASRQSKTHAKPKKNPYHVVDLQVFMTRDFAVAAGIYESTENGKTTRGRWTDSFQWDGAAWHAVFSQATPMKTP